jgi:hypothetical protein
MAPPCALARIESIHTGWPRILPISVAAVAYINGDAGSERDARRAPRISN